MGESRPAVRVSGTAFDVHRFVIARSLGMCDGDGYGWLAMLWGFFPLIHARILVLFEGGRICINRWVMVDNLWGMMMSLVL